MNCLSDLNEALLKKGQIVEEYNGYTLIYKGDSFGMVLGEFYINGTIIKKKDLISQLKIKG